MTPTRQKIIEDLYKYFKKVMICLLCIFGLLLLDKLFRIMLNNKFGIGYEYCSWYPIAAPIYDSIVGAVTFLSMISVFIWLALYLVRTILCKDQSEDIQNRTKRRIAYNGKSPLIGLDDKQTAKVHEWLNGILVENGHLKTSELVQLLRALKGRGDLDDSDKELLILWVESITGKEVDRRNFLYDYDNKYSKPKVDKKGENIWKEFEKLR